MAEKNDKQKISLKMVQKTSILGTDKEGNTTYKMSFFMDDKPVKSGGGMEVYAIEVINKDGVLVRYELYGEIPDGMVLEYYETGEIMLEKHYFNSQKNGQYKLFYPSGAVWKDGKFASDQMVRLKTFAENGKLLADKIYAEIVSVSTGDLEVFYKNGREIARWTHEKDGIIKKYGETIDGVVQYYIDNALKEEHIYDDGFLVTIKKYNKKGQVLTQRDFPKGDTPSIG
jgi:antitoxin component YwqK of YwqJK toxin-antitoxin module